MKLTEKQIRDFIESLRRTANNWETYVENRSNDSFITDKDARTDVRRILESVGCE